VHPRRGCALPLIDTVTANSAANTATATAACHPQRHPFVRKVVKLSRTTAATTFCGLRVFVRLHVLPLLLCSTCRARLLLLRLP